MKFRSAIFGVFTTGFLVLALFEVAEAQYRYEEEPVLQIIDKIQKQTPFYFLYRDALVSDIKLSFTSNEERLFTDFKAALALYDLQLEVDSSRHQAIIYQQKSNSEAKSKTIIKGQVIDARTGERLPYATVSWKNKNSLQGTSANQSGVFHISRSFDQNKLEIKSSYVGYAPKTIMLNLSELKDVHELSFRLTPMRIDGNELIITGSNFYNNISPQTASLVDIGILNPLGETNSLRALQGLPSVSLAPAISDGLHVRGSPNDGLQVLIDGITIYNQSHLFGLVDSFNSDILQRSGFYYDIAPAHLQAPPGGTLSMLTKTGSMNRISGQAGLSNSSFRLALEGPIQKGQSSWLIAGRTSYMNTVNWLNNSDLIEWGLDINRDRELLDNQLINLQSRMVRPGENDASFFDLHGKLYFEGNNGSRLVFSGYFGGDETQQEAERLYRTFSNGNFEFRPITTINDWQNGAASMQYQYWLTESTYANTTAGVSIYKTSFSKDDFTYIDFNNPGSPLRVFVFPFENQSVLNEIKAEQKFEFNADPWLFTAGASYKYYLGEYYEDSFDRPGFFTSRRSHKADAYLQIDYSGLKMLDVFAGNRIHYYSNGNYLKWSPRFKMKLFPDSKLSIGGGFSRNHQFLNQLSLSNTVTSDIWIIANKDQPPTSVNYYSAGLYFSLSKHFYFQTESYLKQFDNLRLHELNTFSLSNTFNNSPWHINNDGTGKGVEFLLKNKFSFFNLTQTFAISKMQISNSSINDGAPFYADWDRTYHYAASLEVNPITDLSIYFSWMYATGTPNKLAIFGPANEGRLDDYGRADISAEYSWHFNNGHLKLSLSFFNVLNRQNPWYRELTLVFEQASSENRFRTVPVDVYDIGMQPSFNISVAF